MFQHYSWNLITFLFLPLSPHSLSLSMVWWWERSWRCWQASRGGGGAILASTPHPINSRHTLQLTPLGEEVEELHNEARRRRVKLHIIAPPMAPPSHQQLVLLFISRLCAPSCFQSWSPVSICTLNSYVRYLYLHQNQHSNCISPSLQPSHRGYI